MTDNPIQLVVCGLPKSANVYIGYAATETLGCERFVFCSRGFNVQRVLPDALWQFINHPNVIGGQHAAPEPFNLNLFHEAGIKRIAILVRDPRDAVISFFHHMARPTMRNSPWIDATMIAAGGISKNYRLLSRDEQIADMFAHSYPIYEGWLRGWAGVIDNDRRFQFHVMRYEDFVGDAKRELRRLCQFFGHDVEPVLPEHAGETDGGVDTKTQLRRGVVGSHRDELPPTVLNGLRLDPDLAKRWDWH